MSPIFTVDRSADGVLVDPVFFPLDRHLFDVGFAFQFDLNPLRELSAFGAPASGPVAIGSVDGSVDEAVTWLPLTSGMGTVTG